MNFQDLMRRFASPVESFVRNNIFGGGQPAQQQPLASPLPTSGQPIGQNLPVYGPAYPGPITSLGGGGGNRNPQPTQPAAPQGPSEQDLAQQAYNNRINAVRSLFDRTKQQANDIRGQAAKTFEDLIKAVGAFRERATTQFNNAGQEITNRSSEILGQNARTGQEALGTSRAIGRALGLGDSSKFNQQNKVIASLAGTQGNTLAKKGEENRANQALLQERNDQAQANEDEAGRYRTAVEDEARRLETTGIDQFGENIDAASSTLGNSLNSIINYQRQLAAIAPLQAGGLTQMAPNFDGIVNTLNGVLPNATGAAAPTTLDGAVNINNDPSYQEYLKRRGLYQG